MSLCLLLFRETGREGGGGERERQKLRDKEREREKKRETGYGVFRRDGNRGKEDGESERRGWLQIRHRQFLISTLNYGVVPYGVMRLI